MNIFVGVHWADYIGLFNVKVHFLHIHKVLKAVGLFDPEESKISENNKKQNMLSLLLLYTEMSA